MRIIKEGWMPTFWDRVIAIPVWIVGLLWFVPMILLLTLLAFIMHPNRVEKLSHLFCRIQIKAIFTRWRSVSHPEVDPNKPYMFVQNHTNHFDFVMCYPATPHFLQGLELARHFKWPLYGWYMKARGTIPVEKGETGQMGRVLAAMRQEISCGHSLLVFPEGTRTMTGELGRFRNGTFRMARELGIPIVPITVAGAFDVMRKGSLVIRPFRTITVYIDKPIETAGINDDELDEVRAQTHAIISSRLVNHDPKSPACISLP